MESKEEILGELDNWTVNGVPFNVSTTDALKAMDIYAKQECIAYNKWTSEYQWHYLSWGASRKSGWHKGTDYSSEAISDEHLYELYLLQSKQK